MDQPVHHHASTRDGYLPYCPCDAMSPCNSASHAPPSCGQRRCKGPGSSVQDERASASTSATARARASATAHDDDALLGLFKLPPRQRPSQSRGSIQCAILRSHAPLGEHVVTNGEAVAASRRIGALEDASNGAVFFF
ncbi:hypothetical protein PMIN02_006603 [Paraphaeosphaeria minitans]